MSNVQIEVMRRWSDEEIEQLELLVPQVVPFYPPPQVREADLASGIKSVVSNPFSSLIVAKVDDRIIGSVTANSFPKMIGHEGRLNDLVVDQNHRRQGIGRELVTLAIEELTRMGVYKIEWVCDPNNVAAMGLFEYFASRPVGTNKFRIFTQES